MQAVILAGGAGKRIRPLGVRKPKSMYVVVGKPIITHVLMGLKQAGIEDVVIVVGECGEPIKDNWGSGARHGLSIRYVHQPNPLGQADALMAAEPLVKERVLVANAADIHDPSLVRQMVASMDRCGAEMVLAGRSVPEPWRYGVMAFASSGKLLRVVEKPSAGSEPSDVAVLGMYLFSRRIFDCISRTPLGETDDQFERAYQTLIDEGSADYVRYDGVFEAFKYPWDLLRLNDVLLARGVRVPRVSPTARIHDSALLDGPVHICDGVRVLEHAVIRGPAFIGPDSVVGNNALIRDGVSLGRHVVIGFGTEVKHSVIGDDCETHMAYVGDSVIADHCALGAGTITANLRLDRGMVKAFVGQERRSSGHRHLGAIMAEDCRTGCNATLMPGVKLGPNSVVGPGVVLTRDLDAGKAVWLSGTALEIRESPLPDEASPPPPKD